MTNEELDRARVDEAIRTGNGIVGSVALIAARLAREGWMPPEPVDPDLEEADKIRYAWENNILDAVIDVALAGIKRGRALAAEAKPGVVWVKHNGSGKCPVAPSATVICRFVHGTGQTLALDEASHPYWPIVTHYAIITPPAEDK